MPTSTWTRRLGAHHFAHLRAVAEGLPVEVSAARYLGTDTKAAARQAHGQVVELLRGVARRRGDPRWRLIGLQWKAPTAVDQPSLVDWAQAQGLADGWSEAELREMHAEAFPADRRQLRATRLRQRQLELLRDLERIAAETPRPSDLIDGWFDSLTAERLKRTGMLTLEDLRLRIARGGRWYGALPAVGTAKAARIAAHLATLLPGPPALPAAHIEACTRLLAAPAVVAVRAGLDGSLGLNRAALVHAGTQAQHDRAAIEAWLAAKAGRPGEPGHVAATWASYRREAERFLLWCIAERHKPLSSATAEDCAAYMAFLAEIPPAWMSRRHAARLGPGWTPFAGPLSVSSRQHAVNVVAGLCDWLVQARYLASNPWRLVKRRLGDDAARSGLDSRAFTPAAWNAIVQHIEGQPPCPARARALFLLRFGAATGLRAAELLAATVGQLRQVEGRWILPVHGKGARNRLVAVPSQAVRALEESLHARGLGGLAGAPGDAPLVCSTLDPMAPVGYRALHASLKAWLLRAVRASALSDAEKAVACRASLHWLRHTHGTRTLERGGSLAALQRQLGHADPRTTMRYAKTQLQQLQDEMEAAWG